MNFKYLKSKAMNSIASSWVLIYLDDVDVVVVISIDE